MLVYPEMESWNEFYPSEIFILLADNENVSDAFAVLKKANIGTTIYLGQTAAETTIAKKIRDIEVLDDINSSLLLLWHVKLMPPLPPGT